MAEELDNRPELEGQPRILLEESPWRHRLCC
jgi:hypothetical protein